MPQRLPTLGESPYKTILDGFLLIAHNADGTLLTPVVLGADSGAPNYVANRTLLKLNGGIEFNAVDLGPNYSDSLHVSGISGREITGEAAFDYAMVFRSGGFLFEDVPGEAITWRFIIDKTGKANFGMASSTTVVPLSQLEVSGNFAVGVSYAGDTAAPTNGMIVQGNVGIGTKTVSGRLHVVDAPLIVTLESTDVNSMFTVVRTNATDRWALGVASGSAAYEFREGGTGGSSALTVTAVGNVALPGYGGGSGQITVGAADSGGLGFKVLRVPN